MYEVVRGRPHVRVENRVLPAGPTVVDILANAAFYYGLVRQLAGAERPIWSQMSFSAAEDNLHAGARDGIEARVYWPGVGDVPVTELVLRRLLPLAHEGLERYGVDPHARDRLLGIIERRCVEEANGATWQSAHLPHALRGRRPRPRRGAARDDRALPRAHARQRARAHLAGLSAAHPTAASVAAVPAVVPGAPWPPGPSLPWAGVIVSGSRAGVAVARAHDAAADEHRCARPAAQRDARVGARGAGQRERGDAVAVEPHRARRPRQR